MRKPPVRKNIFGQVMSMDVHSEHFLNRRLPSTLPVTMPIVNSPLMIRDPNNRSHVVKTTTLVGVDTGAYTTFMPDTLLAEMRREFPNIKVKQVPLTTAGGKVQASMMEDVEICVGACCGRTNLIFAPTDHKIPVNLGMDFLSRSGTKLNLGDCSMSCTAGRVPMACPKFKD